jgi:hypothetical protein
MRLQKLSVLDGRITTHLSDGYDQEASTAAFDDALDELPDGRRLYRELAWRFMGKPAPGDWLDGPVSRYAHLSFDELVRLLAGPLEAKRKADGGGISGADTM